MNDNVLILLFILVAANLVLIAIVLIRSLMRRRREAPEGPQWTEVPERPIAGSRGYVSPMPSETPTPSSRLDPLTGLLVTSEWNRIILDEDARNHRYGRPATVVIVELGGFDRLVNTLGREAGDRVLPAVADALRRNARAADYVARLGTGRFGVLLPETAEVEAVNYVERVRSACELWLEAGAIALELAMGWASPAADTTLVDAAAVAQERMFTELRRGIRRSNDLDLGDGPSSSMPDAEGSPFPV
jgi:diguanylate cyclase (GGDEF)-like protein